MISTLLILLPIFALIFAGYFCRLRGVLGPQATSEINRFVVWLALPAVLFDIMANTSWSALYQPAFLLDFLLANATIFFLVLAWQVAHGQHLVDASIGAMAAAYPNVGFIGFPLLLVVFGKGSLLPTTIATIIVACIMFAIAISLIEAGLQVERHPRKLAGKVFKSVFRNPLIIAPVLGLLFSLSGLKMAVSVEQYLKLMGGAASPCALVCVGLFLADQALKAAADQHAAASAPAERPHAAVCISLIKLFAQPALTWLLASSLLPMPAESRHMAVLLAALPTGTGPFMLAEYYGRNGRLASRVILLTSVASLVTLAMLMAWLGVTPA